MYLDKLVGYLIEQLKSHHLFGKINVIFTSDHGMESSNESIFLNKYVDTSLFETFGGYAVMSIFLRDASNKNLVYEKLKKIENSQVYKAEDIPEELHVKNNVRIGDILVVAKIGYMLMVDENSSYTLSNLYSYLFFFN